MLAVGSAQEQTVAEVTGTVTFNGAPVPGVTVTATRNETRVSTTTDALGTYRLRGLDAGTWTVSTALAGFAPASTEVIVPPTGPVPALTLTLLPFNQVPTVRVAPASSAPATAAQPNAAPSAPSSNAAPSQTPAPRPAPAAAAGAPAAAFPGDNADDASAAADGFLINGSVNNGAASPFAQARAFGNTRPGGR